jgi:GNAT superfamily N-acetyltransferase
MRSPPTPIPYADIPGARTAYGRGTAVWSSSGHLEVEVDWWLAFSLTPYVDYNLALLHGDTAVHVAPHVLDAVAEAGVPAVVMLAGAGLGAAEVLSAAGWACTGSLPFMCRDDGPAADDPCVRPLGPQDLADARHLAGSAFAVPDGVGAIVYAEDALGREGARLWGLFEEGTLRCCCANQYVGDRYSVGWGLSTAPADQRSGYGRRLMRASAARRLAEGPPIALLMATPTGRRLYEQEGYVTLEHWQIWSRPRWVLP